MEDSKELVRTEFRTDFRTFYIHTHALVNPRPLSLHKRIRYKRPPRGAGKMSSAVFLRRFLANLNSILTSQKRLLYSTAQFAGENGTISSDGPPEKNRSTTGKIRADDGVELYYEICGGGPRAVILIPGALGSVGTDFGPQMDHFGREGSEFTVVGFDPRGYGKSRPHKRDFSAPEFYRRDARDAAGVMTSLGFQKFSVLGWSDGGVSGIIAAAMFPSRVQKLVVWGSNAYVSDEDVELVEITRDVDQWSNRMKVAMEMTYGGDFPGMWSNWMDGFVGVNSDPERKGDLCMKEVSEVDCPTLVVHGTKDVLCPAFHADYLARNLKDCRLVMWPEGKHNLHLKHHQEFNKLVTEFLT